MSNPIDCFFVYGTLKKGQLRGGLWPRSPLSIRPAILQAELYDLGPYPAAVEGSGWILGELWQFREEDMPITIEVLDRIEGYEALGENNEYFRVAAQSLSGTDKNLEFFAAYTYFKERDQRLKTARLIAPYMEYMGKSVAAWPDSLARVPRSFAEE